MVMKLCVCVSGLHEMVGTWRPSDSAGVNRLRRFFVGRALRLSDVSYVSKPSDFEVSYNIVNTRDTVCNESCYVQTY